MMKFVLTVLLGPTLALTPISVAPALAQDVSGNTLAKILAGLPASGVLARRHRNEAHLPTACETRAEPHGRSRPVHVARCLGLQGWTVARRN